MGADEQTNGRAFRTRLPSPGFVILAAAFAAVSAFFLFGMTSPELDRCWRLLNEMKVGRDKSLSSSDAALLRRTLVRYPGLCPSLLDEKPAGLLSAHTGGWIETGTAWLLADPVAGTDPVARLTCCVESASYPMKVSFQGAEASLEIEFQGPGAKDVKLTRELRSGGGLIGLNLLPSAGSKTARLDSGFHVAFPEAGP